jgi:DNA-binding CsgD family transcriptional regulator/GAF domain-containing protein
MDDFAEDLFDFVGEVAAAATMADLERRYLDGIGRFVRCAAAGIYVLNPFTRGTESVAARGVSDYFLARYEELGRHQDPVLERALRDLRAVHSGALMSLPEWEQLPVYGEVFVLHRMTGLMEAPLLIDGSPVGTLNFGRTSEEGAFVEDERRLADAIARLLGTALAALRASNSLARERDQVLAALELCEDAVVVTDLGSAERRMNAAARRLLSRLEQEQAAFDELMVHPLREGQSTRHETPARLSDGRQVVLAARSVPAGEDDSVLISFLELLAEGERPSPLSMHLTPRELEVAELAAGGLRDAEIAAQLYLSPHTVKQYLKSVYSKAGVRSRVELTRLLLRPRGD